MEHLTLGHEERSQSSEEHSEVDRIEWRELLRSFSNVKAIRVGRGLVEEFSRCLRLEDGEYPLELYSNYRSSRIQGATTLKKNVFTSFVNARRNAGRPVPRC